MSLRDEALAAQREWDAALEADYRSVVTTETRSLPRDGAVAAGIRHHLWWARSHRIDARIWRDLERGYRGSGNDRGAALAAHSASTAEKAAARAGRIAESLMCAADEHRSRAGWLEILAGMLAHELAERATAAATPQQDTRALEVPLHTEDPPLSPAIPAHAPPLSSRAFCRHHGITRRRRAPA